MSTRRASLLRVGGWAALVVVVAVALAVGASGGGAPTSAQQRAAAIDGVIRCPSCDGISVADSSAATAVAVRQAVLARVRAGQSAQQIEAFLVGRYGPSILLRPPVSGVTVWVWVLPPLALAAAAGALATVFVRRRRAGPTPVPASGQDRVLVERALADRARPEGVLADRAGTGEVSHKAVVTP